MLLPRYSLFALELLFSLAGLALTVRVMWVRGWGWTENIIIIPALFIQLLVAGYWVWLAIEYGGDFPVAASHAYLAHIALVAYPAAIVFIMGIRLWKPGK